MQLVMFTGNDVLDVSPAEAPEGPEREKIKPDTGRGMWPIAITVVFATFAAPFVWGVIIAAVTLVG